MSTYDGHRRMTAFHKDPHPGRIPSRYRRPADDGVSRPFGRRYRADRIAYRIMSGVFRILEPLTRRW